MKQTIERTKKKERQRVKGNKLTDIVENEREQLSNFVFRLKNANTIFDRNKHEMIFAKIGKIQ